MALVFNTRVTLAFTAGSQVREHGLFASDYLERNLRAMLLAVGRTPMTRWTKALILVGVAVDLAGAIDFKRP